jgi:hypothetical protein
LIDPLFLAPSSRRLVPAEPRDVDRDQTPQKGKVHVVKVHVCAVAAERDHHHVSMELLGAQEKPATCRVETF